MNRTLIMVRHGETEFNAVKRMQGHLDSGLSVVGRNQARATGRALATLGSLNTRPVSRIISSDLGRAALTANIIGEEVGQVPLMDARLRETDLGQWQGKAASEVDAEWPGARAVWRHDPTWAPPGGESRMDVARRARAVVDELMASPELWDEGPVVLVAHSGTIIALTTSLLGLSKQQSPLLTGMRNGRMAIMTARPKVDYLGRAPEELPAEAPTFSAQAPGEPVEALWYLDAWNVGDIPTR